MSLSLSLAIAASEIGNIDSRFALLGHNVANASTPGYAVESAGQQSLTAGGVGLGAREGIAQRSIDTQLQSGLFAQNGAVASLQTQQAALQQIDAAQGKVGGGTDIGSRLGALQNQFAALQTDPSNATQQSAVVGAAQQLAQQINRVSDSVATQRQAAQTAIGAEVQTLNTTLASIGGLNRQIVNAKALGQSTADLQNQRDAAVQTLSGLVSVTAIDQPDGSVLLACGGLVLPTDGTAFATAAATIGPSSFTPGGGVPPITLNGQDVTAQLTGGSLGGEIALRDQTLPTVQANLDEFAETLSTRFAAQGLTLFTDAAGNVPAGGGAPVQSSYLGYASEIQVNPAVLAAPSLVRDGTTAVAGSPTGASSFTPNPAGGPAGFATMIARVLNFSFGADAQAGVAQPAPATGGLGPSGGLSAGFAAPADLAGLATAVVGQEAQASASITSRLGDEQTLQTTLQAQLSAGSAVNIDTQMSEMIQLQNAYEANTHVLSAVQAMFAQLQQSVQA
jgi:flagellar hook-associated protein 1 FlgK